LKFTSGTLNTTAEAGAVEFLTDEFYGTVTTSAVRRQFVQAFAPVDLTGQSAAISATTIFAVPAAGLGMYRVSWVATITTVDAVSSVLGGATGFQVKYTDGDDSVVKTTAAPVITSAANTTGTQISGTFNAYCKASTNLQYAFGYTAGGGQMRYNLHIRVERIA